MSSTISGDDITYTSGQWVGSEIILRNTLSANSTDVTPDATSFASQFGGIEAIGTPYEIKIINNDPTFAIALTEGIGFTMLPSSISMIQPGTANEYLIVITSATTCDIYNLSYNGTPLVAESVTTIVNTVSPNMVLEDPGVGVNTVTFSAPDPVSGSYTVTMPPAVGTLNQILSTDASGNLSWVNGNMVGPGSSTDNAITRFDGVTGNIVQNSGILLDDADSITGVVGLTASGTVSGGTITDGTASINSGAISGVTTIGASGAITATGAIQSNNSLILEDPGAGSNTVTIQAPTLNPQPSYSLTLPNTDGSNGEVLTTDGTGVLSWGAGGSGFVVGPASATDNAIPRYDTTTGKLIQNSGIVVDDSDNMTGVRTIDIGNGLVPTENGEIFTDIDIDSTSFSGSQGIGVNYEVGTVQANNEAVLLVNINDDNVATTGGSVSGLVVTRTEANTVIASGLTTTSLVDPVLQFTGDWTNIGEGRINGSVETSNMNNSGVNSAIFSVDTNTVLVGNSVKFQEISFTLSTESSESILPTFEYSIAGTDNYNTFSVIDSLRGFKNSGVLAWNADDIPLWTTNDATSNYEIRITRTNSGSIATTPVLKLAQLSGTGNTNYSWNKSGHVSINTVIINGTTSGKLTLDVPATVTDYAITFPPAVGLNNQVLATDASGNLSWVPPNSATGDVVGPASATDNAIARFDTGTGKLIQNSGPLINDTGEIDMNAQKITDVLDPTADQDAATKAYVDSVASGLLWKDPSRGGTTANITLGSVSDASQLADLGPIDGITFIQGADEGDRLLVKNQTTLSQNGIYVLTLCTNTSFSYWTRSSDMSSGSAEFFANLVENGTINSGTGWTVTGTSPYLIDSSNIIWDTVHRCKRCKCRRWIAKDWKYIECRCNCCSNYRFNINRNS